MLSLIVSIIALGFIVAFHEFGHFMAARACGVGVIEFSVGMGPRIISGVKGHTRYSLRALPFGGSCMMLGEETDEQDDAERTSSDIANGTLNGDEVKIEGDSIIIDGRSYHKDEQFVRKPAWKRFLIIAAGPFFNFLLAFLFALIITANYGYDRSDLVAVTEGSPADEAGMEAGDIITGLGMVNDDGSFRLSRIETARDIQLFMLVNEEEKAAGNEIAVRYMDASDDMAVRTAAVQAVLDEESGAYLIGFTYNSGYQKSDSIADTLKFAFYDVKYCIKASVLSVKMLISGSVSRSDVMGPVRMVATMDESVETAADYGIMAAAMTLINLVILISGSLGAMNLLPLPALDGGRLVFIIIEMITRHPVPKEVEGRIHMAGMLLLLLLMVLILFNDVTMLIFG